MSAPSTSSRKTSAKSAARKTRAKAASPKKTTKAKSKSKTVTPPALTQPVEVKAVSVAPPAANPVITDEQIGQRAYQIWIEKGRPYGQEDANWQQAVAELRGE